MKRKSLVISIMVLVIAMIAMVSCSSSSFGSVTADDHHMTVTAENADKGDSTLSGNIVVGDDEQIVIDSMLDEGGVQIEFFSSEDFGDQEDEPDFDELEAKYTANVSGQEGQAVAFGGGDYMVRVTVTEKATGTVEIQVKGFGE